MDDYQKQRLAELEDEYGGAEDFHNEFAQTTVSCLGYDDIIVFYNPVLFKEQAIKDMFNDIDDYDDYDEAKVDLEVIEPEGLRKELDITYLEYANNLLGM